MRARLLTAAAFVLGVPAAAFACPVCGFAGTGSNSWAYEAMTVLLSGVPLAMIGGISFWIVRRARRQAESQSTDIPARSADRPVGAGRS